MKYRVLRKMLEGYETVAEFRGEGDAFTFLDLKISQAADDIFEIKASDAVRRSGKQLTFSETKLLYAQAKEDAAELYRIEEIKEAVNERML